MKFEDILFIIPARGGSKGIPEKNIKPFLGKPLIYYSIEYARLFTNDENICLTTDNDKIIAFSNKIGLNVPFIRPDYLANDTADTFAVLKHAYHFYKSRGWQYKTVVLLQPTSPIRETKHLEEAIQLLMTGVEMVVSVCEAKSNPYFTLFEENKEGLLAVSKGAGIYTRRQDTPKVYEYNGSIYIIDSSVFEQRNSFKEITRKVKYVMEQEYAIDLDTPDDWEYAEYIQNKKSEILS